MEDLVCSWLKNPLLTIQYLPYIPLCLNSPERSLGCYLYFVSVAGNLSNVESELWLALLLKMCICSSERRITLSVTSLGFEDFTKKEVSVIFLTNKVVWVAFTSVFILGTQKSMLKWLTAKLSDIYMLKMFLGLYRVFVICDLWYLPLKILLLISLYF